jgi:hypothetical protein
MSIKQELQHIVCPFNIVIQATTYFEHFENNKRHLLKLKIENNQKSHISALARIIIELI